MRPELIFIGRKNSRSGSLKRKKLIPPETEAIIEPIHKPSSSWAGCIKQIYELNPLECPRCKSQMRILTFVHDPLEIKKIMKSQGIPDFTAPPPIPDFSRHNEIFDEMPDLQKRL